MESPKNKSNFIVVHSDWNFLYNKRSLYENRTHREKEDGEKFSSNSVTKET